MIQRETIVALTKAVAEFIDEVKLATQLSEPMPYRAEFNALMAACGDLSLWALMLVFGPVEAKLRLDEMTRKLAQRDDDDPPPVVN